MGEFEKDRQYLKFCLYGFLKNLRFYDAFLLIFFLENGVNYSQIGILYAARELTINVSEIPSGIIADTYGRKNSLLVALLLYILSFVVFYFSTSFVLLLISMVLLGIGDAFRSGTHKGMIMDYLRIRGWEEQKIAYYGHTRSWSQKGSAISALMAGVMVFYVGDYRVIYIISVIPYLLNLINICSYPKELNYAIKSNTNERSSFKSTLKDVVSVLQQNRVVEILNSTALHSAFLKSIKDYIQAIMISIAIILPIGTDLDIKSKNGLVIGLCYFFIFLLTSYASKSSGRVSSLNIVNIERGALLLGLSFGILCGLSFHFEFGIISILAFVLIYIIENLRKPILTGFLSDNVPNEILTSVISAQSFYQTIAVAIFAMLLGVSADWFGIGIAIMVISIVLFIFTITMGMRSRIRDEKTA